MLQEKIKKLQGGMTPYLTMYFVFKGNDEPIIRQVDIDEKAKEDFAMKFRNFLVDNYSSEDLKIANVSNADERIYNALVFDIELVQPLQEVQNLYNNPDAEKYSHSKDKNLKIDGYAFILGNDKVKFAMYKEHYPLDTITRDSFMLIGRSDSRFVSIKEDEIFRLNSKIDFLLTDEHLYVLNMKVMETNFGIHNVLKKKAENIISQINQMGFIENPEFINDIINSNPTFARKILRVNIDSPVIQMPISDIKTFIQKHPHLNGRLGFNKKGNKFLLNTKVSATLFIKLMDDDFLKSDLTQRLYDSIAKDRLEN